MCALIKTSGVGITEISGKFGGSVGARNTSGNVLRNRVKGTNARTNAQITQRGKLSNTSAAWRSLTAAERKSFVTAASSGQWPYQNRLGETKQPSGFQLYSTLNNNISVVGGTPLTEPPLKVGFTAITLGALTAAAGTPALSLAFTGVLDASESMVVFATYGMSPGVARPNRYKQIAIYGSTTPANLLAGYTAIFGALVAGTQIFVRVKLINDGTGENQEIGQVSAIVAA